MPDLEWKHSLAQDLVLRGFLATTGEELMDVVLPHIDAAYQRGLIAGRSQAGYREKPVKVRLTDRQLEIARLAAAGLTNPEIAKRLFLSTDTVRTHMRHALKRTGARSRGHLAALLAVSGQVTNVNIPNPEENSACPADAPSAGSPSRAWTTEVADGS